MWWSNAPQPNSISSGCAPRKRTFFPKKFIRLFVQDCVRSHGECSKRLYFYRSGMKAETVIGKLLKPTHMLADGNTVAKQDRMRGTHAICYVINIIGIDTNKGRA